MTKKQFPEGFFTKDRPAAKPRLIDADGLREYWLINGKNEKVYSTNDFLDSIDEQPTVDVIELDKVKQIIIDSMNDDNWHNEILVGLFRKICGPQTDGSKHFTEPIEEENKAFDDYYKSIGTKSKENFFDGDEHDNG